MEILKSKSRAPLTLVRGGRILAPEDLGQQDLLIAAGKIVAVGRAFPALGGNLANEVDASGLLVLPGFIDAYVHILGGGGAGGPETRARDIMLSSITRAGFTSIIGMLGFDCVTRHLESLLAKARALTAEGVTTYVLLGGYTLPPPTITGSITRDVAFINEVLGVGMIAVSDHRGSQPSVPELAKLAAEARVGGMVGKKAGILFLHVGDGPRALGPVRELLATTDIPITQIVPLHVNRNSRLLEESMEFARKGGTVALTATAAPALGLPNAIKPSQAVKQLLEAGIGIDQMFMVSAANGNNPIYNEDGEVVGLQVQEVAHLYNEIRDLVAEEKLPVETAIKLVTSSVARAFRLAQKGTLAVGGDADLVLAEPDLTLRAVFGGGRLMVRDGEAVVKGIYE